MAEQKERRSLAPGGHPYILHLGLLSSGLPVVYERWTPSLFRLL